MIASHRLRASPALCSELRPRVLWREQRQVFEHLARLPVDRLCRECGWLISHVGFVERAVNDASTNQAVAQRHERIAIRDSAENEGRMNAILRNQLAGRSNARVNSLNGLVSERDVAANGNVQVTVGDLQHGFGPVRMALFQCVGKQ